MKVLVAGASGFIGSAVARALYDAGHEVVGLSRTRGSLPEEASFVSADITTAPLDPSKFQGVEAIVNLVGIAIERGSNTFEAAHVHAVEHLLALGNALDVDRFVHISVVRPGGSDGGYHRTKREGEARVRASDRQWTILRPGLVYGPGDAMLSNLVRFVTLAPVFVAPGGSTGPLQTVDVLDVARAVVCSLHDARTTGKTIDVVGPTRTDLPSLVHTVAHALQLPTAIAKMPAPLMRLAAAAMQAVLPNPPITPTQLGMLIDGLYGEHRDTVKHLGFEPRALTDARVQAVAQDIDAPSVRLVPNAAARASLRAWSVSPLFILLAVAALLLGPWLIADLWIRMLVLEVALVAVLARSNAPLRRWLVPRGTWVGVGAATVMVAAALGVTAVLHRVAPGLMLDATQVYGWASSWPLPATLVMLPIIAAAEDLVWRFGITLGLVRRLGAAGAVAAGGVLFAVAHLTTGPPILAVAALLAGLAWSALAVRTRAWLPVFICHLLWDVSLVALAP
mgnify:CR=1 FL=1